MDWRGKLAMTQHEMDELQTWQSSPEGNAYMSVRDAEIAITAMEELLAIRDGRRFLRQEVRNLIELRHRLNDVIAEIQPSVMVG